MLSTEVLDKKNFLSFMQLLLFNQVLGVMNEMKPFDLTKESEQRKCFHYSNLQILTARENLTKGAIYEKTT